MGKPCDGFTGHRSHNCDGCGGQGDDDANTNKSGSGGSKGKRSGSGGGAGGVAAPHYRVAYDLHSGHIWRCDECDYDLCEQCGSRSLEGKHVYSAFNPTCPDANHVLYVVPCALLLQQMANARLRGLQLPID